MRAVQILGFGEPEVLTLVDLDRPEAGPGEVRVRVGASFVAFGRDVTVRSGRHPVLSKIIRLPHILGGEHAGVIDQIGLGADGALLGRHVAVSAPTACATCKACLDGRPWDCTATATIGIHREGSNAGYTVVPSANVHLIPPDMSFTNAAALAGSGPLAWEELDIGGVGEGSWILVPGASGSVGTLLVALAARRGAHVVAATRGARAADALTALGAEAVVDSDDLELAQRLRSISPHGIDAVVDNVANPDMFYRYWPAVARRGHIVIAGQAGGSAQPLPIDVVSFYNRRATITGLVVGDPRPVAAFWDEMRREALDLGDGLIETFALADAASAHRRIEEGSKVGHVVLAVG